MKISRTALVVWVATVVGNAVAQGKEGSPFLRGDVRELGCKVKDLKAYYSVKRDKCILTYDDKDGKEKELKFDGGGDLSYNERKVVCTAYGGDVPDDIDDCVSLPFQTDINTKNAEWINEDGVERPVDLASLVWRKNLVKLVIKRERFGMDEKDLCVFDANYDPDLKKCYLEYQVKENKEDKNCDEFNKKTIQIKGDDVDVSPNGRKVVCQVDEEAKAGLELPLRAWNKGDFKKATWDGDKKKLKNASLRWREDEYFKMVFEKEAGDNFKWIKGYYDPDASKKKERCYFDYMVERDGDKKTYTVYLGKDITLKQNGDKVICTTNEDPDGGLNLPLRVDEDDDDVTFYFDGDKGADGSIVWQKDGDVKVVIEK